jgi:hypothetical protein
VLGALGTADQAPATASARRTHDRRRARATSPRSTPTPRERQAAATFTLDVVHFANAERRAAFARELADSVAALAAKYHDEHTAGGRRFRLVATIHPAIDPVAGPNRGDAHNTRRSGHDR